MYRLRWCMNLRPFLRPGSRTSPMAFDHLICKITAREKRLEIQRAAGFLALQCGREIQRAAGFPGLQRGRETSRIGGWASLRRGRETQKVTGFPALQRGRETQRANGHPELRRAVEISSRTILDKANREYDFRRACSALS